MAERSKPIRVRGLHAGERDEDLDEATPSERISMVWLPTLKVWSFKEETFAESRLQRHSARVLGRG